MMHGVFDDVWIWCYLRISYSDLIYNRRDIEKIRSK